ncbi:hypothetical protein AA313_de0207459 [Arthrobotrys entomopaga]|nr:hypothetical protein AA313_de0207459 [Arthrobotrys entomopaga]
MDHLYSERLSNLPDFQFPYICNADDYEYSEDRLWRDFPSVNIKENYFAKFERASKDPNLPLASLAPLVQQWLFFGVLKEISGIFNVDFQLSDFVRRTDSGREIVVTSSLHRYMWTFCTIFYAYENRWMESPKPQRAIEVVDQAIGIIFLLGHRTDQSIDINSITKEDMYYHETMVSEKMFLQVTLLLELLQRVLQEINGVSLRKFQFNLKNAPMNSLTRRLLVTSGWCIGDIYMHGISSPSCLAFLSMMLNPRSQNHAKCTDTICSAYQVSETVYQTAHIRENCTCPHIPGDPAINLAEPAQKILSQGLIPLLKVVKNPDEPTSVDVVFTAATPSTSYVCISHVWSDGFGNPATNTLPACVLIYIQSLVNAIVPDLKSAPDDNVPFWIDTLCVPLTHQYRKLAIKRMGETYSKSIGILVLDSGLRCISSSSTSTQEIMIRIICSGWMQRLWTFQEVCLAKTSWFQFSDRAIVEENIQSRLLAEWPPTTSQLDIFFSRPEPERTNSDKNAIICLSRAVAAEDDVFNLPPEQLEVVMNTLNIHCPDYTCNPRDDWLYTKLRLPFSFFIVADILYDKLAHVTSQGSWTSPPSENSSKGRDLAFQVTGLQGRTSTKMEDEPVCVATLCGIDPTPILSLPDNKEWKKMRKLLTLTGSFTPGFIFGRFERIKTSVPGWNWAPRTFTGISAYFGVRTDPAPRPKLLKTDEGALEAIFDGIIWEVDLEVLKNSDADNLCVYCGWNNDSGNEAAVVVQLRDEWQKPLVKKKVGASVELEGSGFVKLAVLLPCRAVPDIACVLRVIKEEDDAIHGSWVSNAWVQHITTEVPPVGTGLLGNGNSVEIQKRKSQRWTIH